MVEYNHVCVVGVGVVLETTDKMAAIKETFAQKKLGRVAAIVYSSDLGKLRKQAKQKFGKNWLVLA